MDLKTYFSNSLLQRFRKLNDKIEDSDLRGPDITSKEDTKKRSNDNYFSHDVKEFLDIQKKLTSFLLSEVIDRIELKNNFDVFIEINQHKTIPFNILVRGLEGKVIRGKPSGQYKPNQDPENYIEQEIQEVKKKVELL